MIISGILGWRFPWRPRLPRGLRPHRWRREEEGGIELNRKDPRQSQVCSNMACKISADDSETIIPNSKNEMLNFRKLKLMYQNLLVFHKNLPNLYFHPQLCRLFPTSRPKKCNKFLSLSLLFTAAIFSLPLLFPKRRYRAERSFPLSPPFPFRVSETGVKVSFFSSRIS